MRNFTIYLAVAACLFLNDMFAQTFEDKAKDIAHKIENITKDEKDRLKEAIEAVNIKLGNGEITHAEAEEKKRTLAEATAISIETRVAMAEDELKMLVQDKVDGKIKEADTSRQIVLKWKWPRDRDSIKKQRSEYRTTTQFVFAAGLNNLVTNDQVAHSDYRYWGSHFYEWGFTYNTRLAKNHNLLHLKYGLSLMYNNLRPTNNRMFVDAGTETVLLENATNMKDSRFRNVNLVVPVHLEFDFSGKKDVDGKQVFRTHQGFRVGLGGYAGLNVKSKQILRYDNDGYNSKEITKGDFNVNDLVYGVSAYIGFEETSLYVKYDLNPLFRDNPVDQRNISMGIRFDLN
jgi:hypothetical protein